MTIARLLYNQQGHFGHCVPKEAPLPSHGTPRDGTRFLRSRLECPHALSSSPPSAPHRLGIRDTASVLSYSCHTRGDSRGLTRQVSLRSHAIQSSPPPPGSRNRSLLSATASSSSVPAPGQRHGWRAEGRPVAGGRGGAVGCAAVGVAPRAAGGGREARARRRHRRPPSGAVAVPAVPPAALRRRLLAVRKARPRRQPPRQRRRPPPRLRRTRHQLRTRPRPGPRQVKNPPSLLSDERKSSHFDTICVACAGGKNIVHEFYVLDIYDELNVHPAWRI